MFGIRVGPNALVNWFWYGRHSYRLLVLLGAGDVGQAAFFKEVFEQTENLDIVSGPEIAVFLFGNKHDSAIGGIRGDGPEVLIFPRERIGRRQEETAKAR
jgi:hypothetical protein